MPEMQTVDLTPFKNELSDEELQEFDTGQIVEVPDGVGVIAGIAEEDFEFPVGSEDRIERIEEEEEIDDEEMETIEASEDNPVYIVALQEGGSVAVTGDEISGDATLEGEGEGIESPEEVEEKGDEAELAPIYERVDDPSSRAELRSAKKEMIMEGQAAELADYVEDEDVSLDELEDYSCEELANIRGVDDPEVGFASLPEGWTRKSVLQAWASLGGMWRTCFPRMVRVRGPNFAKRWCSALKDEVLRTEEWRGKF